MYNREPKLCRHTRRMQETATITLPHLFQTKNWDVRIIQGFNSNAFYLIFYPVIDFLLILVILEFTKNELK